MEAGFEQGWEDGVPARMSTVILLFPASGTNRKLNYTADLTNFPAATSLATNLTLEALSAREDLGPGSCLFLVPDFTAKTAATISFGLRARQRNMSGGANEVWGGKYRIAVGRFLGLEFGDGIDNLALAFSTLRRAVVMGVHVLPALCSSL